MRLDLLTIVAFIAAAEIAMGLFTIFIVGRDQDSVRGSRWWGIVTVIRGLAFAGYLFTGGMVPELGRFTLPIIFVLTFWGFAEIISRFLGAPRRREIYAVTILLLCAWQYLSIFQVRSEALRLVGMSLAMTINSIALWRLASGNAGPRSRGRKLLGYIYLSLGIVALTRATFFGMVFGGSSLLAAISADFEKVYFFYLSITLTSSTFAYLIMCNDYYVAEKYRTESERRSAEERFTVIRDNLPHMAWVLRSDGEFAWLNKAWYDYTGTPEGVSAASAYAVSVHPEDIQGVQARIAEALTSKTPYFAEFRIKRADGAYRWILETAVPVSVDGGGLVGSALDITDRREYVIQIEELSRELMRIEEKERADIAGELHDSVAGDLTLALLTAQSRLAKAFGESEPDIEDILAPLRRSIIAVRSISHRLSPLHLESVGLNMAIEDLLDRVTDTGKLKTIEVRLNNLETAFPGGWNLNLYRIVQESLANILKHSTARTLSIACEKRGDYTILNIRDDGSPARYESPQIKGGLGLLLMRQRARTFGGEVETLSMNPGFLVRIVIPPQPAASGG